MPSWLPSLPYPPSSRGYWHPVTSTINWCEEDYYATIYAAEVINTLTNLLFLYLAYKGISNCWTQGHDSIFLVTFVGYLLVGAGSFLFHATLKYPMQLVDELSMIYTTCLMCYATFSYAKTRLYAFILAIALVSLALFITLYYHYLQDPAFHQNAYAILTAVVLLRSMYVMEISIRPSLRRREANHKKEEIEGSLSRETIQEQDRKDRRDEVILKDMWTMIASGLSIFLGGFAIWTLDNEYCSSLRRWRRQIGLPWGILLEGHGWWHLMTGIGAYFYIVWGIWLRHCLNGRQEEYMMYWPRLYVLPEILRREHEPAFHDGTITKKEKSK
ncbi:alkaline phytoceramidase [Xylona heveae TC161]|uniref:Alkaline phytoceramidase n=1 Tax=Xylona heveae (strain CBS 132557 / TC161) TaxID=1328760 RepID=A0A165JIS4_XYLHT|nr:alkaline phytoceramidase [Xylona heveae TC161]KZF26295.1 alkaline phytoceramidase [Xylona heveae TC161]